MTDDIERLLDYGRMGLETGQYEQARKDFEKVLALDPPNRDALRGLARVNEKLSRRGAPDVEMIQDEPVKLPLKPEIPPTEQQAEPPTQRFQEMIKRLARLFGTLAVIGGLLFVLLLPLGILLDVDTLMYLAIGGFYATLFFGVLWFACWALGRLWR